MSQKPAARIEQGQSDPLAAEGSGHRHLEHRCSHKSNESLSTIIMNPYPIEDGYIPAILSRVWVWVHGRMQKLREGYGNRNGAGYLHNPNVEQCSRDQNVQISQHDITFDSVHQYHLCPEISLPSIFQTSNAELKSLQITDISASCHFRRRRALMPLKVGEQLWHHYLNTNRKVFHAFSTISVAVSVAIGCHESCCSPR